jgi:hypothetical protein
MINEKPKNQTAEVLYELLHCASLTRLDFMQRLGILNVTARIANLRIKHNIPIDCRKIEVRNKHGRLIKYGCWSIPAKYVEESKNKFALINK